MAEGPSFRDLHLRPSTRSQNKRRLRPRDGEIIDVNYEQEKERHRRSRLAERHGLDGTIERLVDNMKPWFVTFATGICVGLLAANLSILSSWLSDLRTGVCTAQPHLSRNVCCSGLDPGEPCREWRSWPDILIPAIGELMGSFLAYFIYLVTAIGFASIAAFFVQVYAPYAFHTGIPEIKAILGGLVIENYLGGWTLLIKSVGLSLAVASGLSLGNEGPMVHIACCIGNLFANVFRVFRDNEGRKRDVLSAAAAAGLSVAFGAPLGGVLFSLEEASSFFPGSVLWHSFVCAVVAAFTLQYLDPLGTGRLVLFEVNASTEWRGFELVPWLFLGACGGLFGHYLTRANAEYARFRNRSFLKSMPIYEVAGLAGATALASYLITYTRISNTDLVAALFTDCSGGASDQLNLCDRDASLTIITLLMVTALAKTAFTIATFGAHLPAGIFLPSTAIGACFGRSVGIIMQEWQRAFPTFWLFGSCPPDTPCIAPSLYAVVGAASALGGVTRMTLSLVVVVFELTGAVSLVVQIMSAIMVSKFVGDFLDRDGIYEMWITFRRYSFINPKVDFRRDDLTAASCMTPYRELVVLQDQDTTLSELRHILNDHSYRGFPVIKSAEEPISLGYIARPELEYATKRARRNADPSTRVRFSQKSVEEDEASVADYVEHTPITLTADMPMEVVVQLFQRLGLRYVLFTSKGCLAGLLTKDDIQHLIRTGGSRSARADLVKGVRNRRGSVVDFVDDGVNVDGRAEQYTAVNDHDETTV